MTQQEQIREWEHIYDTRIAILCGQAEPTPAQRIMAIKEADEHLKKLDA